MWSFPRSVTRDPLSVSMKERRCGKQQRLYCSSLSVSPALAQHTGSYRCRYQHKQSKQAMLYVYIAGEGLHLHGHSQSQAETRKQVPWGMHLHKCPTIS